MRSDTFASNTAFVRTVIICECSKLYYNILWFVDKWGKYMYYMYLLLRRPSRTLYVKSWNAKSTAGRDGKCDSVFGWLGTICSRTGLLLFLPRTLGDNKDSLASPFDPAASPVPLPTLIVDISAISSSSWTMLFPRVCGFLCACVVVVIVCGWMAGGGVLGGFTQTETGARSCEHNRHTQTQFGPTNFCERLRFCF